MAGIKVPQYEIFKIDTIKLKYSNWNLNISKEEARKLNQTIMLFEAQEFRLIADILKRPIWTIDFSKYICSIVISSKADFQRATSKNGVIINGITFKRFVGTTGGLKNNTLLFVNETILNELNERCECGRDKSIKLVPAKYEAYKALTCSASQKIISPNKILVVRDCITKYRDTVISLDNNDLTKDSPVCKLEENVELENNVSDGYNLCTYEYMQKISEVLGLDYVTNGVCLRNAWLKGMLYAFPIVEFFDKYCNGNYTVTDVWGHEHDIREIDMILTESSLKLWSAYKSIEEYIENYKNNKYEFSVTKISPHKLDDVRELNYQYLQSYEFDEDDIEELCAPTVKWLKDSMCGDYESTMNFVGITGNEEMYSWQKALSINEYMLGDPYIVDSVNRLIKKKIDGAKIGKLQVHGNYQIASGDPFALMQSIAGLEVTGLLQANECYSKYWIENDVNEVVAFRSPMTSHNNIRKFNIVNNEDVLFWYQYMNNIFILNAWDSSCAALNGADFDGDLIFSTNNNVLVRKYRSLPAICCAQSITEKVVITEKAIKQTNINGMGNKVGTITNRITTMMELLSHFEKGSSEYEELEYRILCGQLHQQDELDKIKGIIARPMCTHWYNIGACKKYAEEKGLDVDYLTSICIDKKPYFMTYVYEDYRAAYNAYNKQCNARCQKTFGCTLEELINKQDLTEEEHEFLDFYNKHQPFGMGLCAMNKICYHVEDQFKNYKTELKANSSFDYRTLQVKHRCTEKHRKELLRLAKDYAGLVAKYRETKAYNDICDMIDPTFIKDKEGVSNSRNVMQMYFYDKAKEICPNDDERLNIILDITYLYNGNRQFCWDTIGDLICKRLEELKDEC